MKKEERVWVRVAPYAIVKFIEALHNTGIKNISVSQEDDTLCVSWVYGQLWKAIDTNNEIGQVNG
ncbi:MAG: hypothetical protein MJZ34_06880 [Paludibacteraceae bacterium]|nr:hypothetical protein [Paludibacteraceae bacterium]